MAGGTAGPTPDLRVDSKNRATHIRIHHFSRPHMRGFHFAWFSFFLAFMGWFALSPLTPVVRVSLGLCENGGWDDFEDPKDCQCNTDCKNKLANANIVALAGTIGMRLGIGSILEAYGPRFTQSSLMVVFAIPLACAGFADTIDGIAAARFFIGGMGATFVVTQFWTSVMFSPKVVGTANATTAGWGHVGASFTHVFMPLVLTWFANLGLGYDIAWRVALLVPAALLIPGAVALYFLSDDSPDGNFQELTENGFRREVSGFDIFTKAAVDPRVWLLFVIYGGCFGTELTMNNVLATYFFDYFGLSTQAAGVATSVFGLMNIFARTLGGIASDLASSRWSHRGRHWVLFITQLFEGILLFGFSRASSDQFVLALVLLAGFSICVQMAEGAVYAIVPYVGRNLGALGPVSGIVGAGGNAGAVAWGFIYRLYTGGDDRVPFMILSFCVIGTALLIPFVHYQEFGSVFLPAHAFQKGSQKDEEEPGRKPAQEEQQL